VYQDYNLGMGAIGDMDDEWVVSSEWDSLALGLRQASELLNSCLRALESEMRVGHGVQFLRRAEQRIATLGVSNQTPVPMANALLAARDELSAHLLAGVMLKEGGAAPAVGCSILRRAARDCQASLDNIRQRVREPVA
jgi:hypothetical protein